MSGEMGKDDSGAPGGAEPSAVGQPVVEIRDTVGQTSGFAVIAARGCRLFINGQDMGHFDGYRVHAEQDELLRVTLTLIPSRLIIGIPGDDTTAAAFGRGDVA